MIFKHKSTLELRIFFVGALVSKPTLYKARSWEFLNIDSIDITDSYQSNISIHVRGNEIYRIQPRSDRFNTNNWLADKSRYLIDSFVTNRIIFPSILIKTTYEYSNWSIIYNILSSIINLHEIIMYMGATCSFEDFSAVYNFQRIIGVNNIYYNYYNTHENSVSKYASYSQFQKNTLKNNFLFNCLIEDLQNYDAFVFSNNKIRYTMPILYNKIKTCAQQFDIECISLGNYAKNNTSINNFMESKNILNGTHSISKELIIYDRIYFFFDKQNVLSIYLENLMYFIKYVNALQQKTIKSICIDSECGALVKKYGEI